MSNPEAALVRAVFAYARACAGIDPVRLTLTLSDHKRRTIELPANPPPPDREPPAGALMLSPDAERVIELLARDGPLAAKAVMSRTDLDRNKVYYLLDDLTARGLIRSGVDGYEVAAVS